MKILLYNPDNGITRNFMPHLWMFLLQSLTPKQHEVIPIDEAEGKLTREIGTAMADSLELKKHLQPGAAPVPADCSSCRCETLTLATPPIMHISNRRGEERFCE